MPTIYYFQHVRKCTYWKTNIQKKPSSGVLYKRFLKMFSKFTGKQLCWKVLSCTPETCKACTVFLTTILKIYSISCFHMKSPKSKKEPLFDSF